MELIRRARKGGTTKGGCPILQQIYARLCIVLYLHYNTVQKHNNKGRSKITRNLIKPCINFSEYIWISRYKGGKWTLKAHCCLTHRLLLVITKGLEVWESFRLLIKGQNALAPTLMLCIHESLK